MTEDRGRRAEGGGQMTEDGGREREKRDGEMIRGLPQYHLPELRGRRRLAQIHFLTPQYDFPELRGKLGRRGRQRISTEPGPDGQTP